MHPRIVSAGLLALTLMVVPGSAALVDTCSPKVCRQISTLKQLPPEVVSSLGQIADRGARYNATDVIDSHLPMRRFLQASMTADQLIVQMECGGFAYHLERVSFRLTNNRWVIETSTVEWAK
jgi:hypothetical protein